jgi:hypothetical protein
VISIRVGAGRFLKIALDLKTAGQNVDTTVDAARLEARATNTHRWAMDTPEGRGFKLSGDFGR